jgi:hypothetical protein
MKYLKTFESIKDFFYSDGSDINKKLSDIDLKIKELDLILSDATSKKNDLLNQKVSLTKKLDAYQHLHLKFGVKLEKASRIDRLTIYLITKNIDENNVECVFLGYALYKNGLEVGDDGWPSNEEYRKIENVAQIIFPKIYKSAISKVGKELSTRSILLLNEYDSNLIKNILSKSQLDKIYSKLLKFDINESIKDFFYNDHSDLLNQIEQLDNDLIKIDSNINRLQEEKKDIANKKIALISKLTKITGEELNLKLVSKQATNNDIHGSKSNNIYVLLDNVSNNTYSALRIGFYIKENDETRIYINIPNRVVNLKIKNSDVIEGELKTSIFQKIKEPQNKKLLNIIYSLHK